MITSHSCVLFYVALLSKLVVAPLFDPEAGTPLGGSTQIQVYWAGAEKICATVNGQSDGCTPDTCTGQILQNTFVERVIVQPGDVLNVVGCLGSYMQYGQIKYKSLNRSFTYGTLLLNFHCFLCVSQPTCNQFKQWNWTTWLRS